MTLSALTATSTARLAFLVVVWALGSVLQNEGALASDRPAQALLLQERASKLESAAAGCRERVRRRELSDCKVEITFQNNRLVSPSEADLIAADLRRQADTLGQPEPTPPGPIRPEGTETSVAAIQPQIRHWKGAWKNEEKEIVKMLLKEISDSRLRNWIAANIEFNRTSVGSSYQKTLPSDMIGVSGSTLNFNDRFFLPTITDLDNIQLAGKLLTARRVNLTTFEAGKAFYAGTKDKKLKDGESLGKWFERYAGTHETAILATKAVKHGGDSLEEVHDPPGDMYSGFGYLFRAQALTLGVPHDFQERMEWLLEKNR